MIWIELLLKIGSKSGYYPQLEKCYCIKIVTGSKYAGGYGGSEQDLEEWLPENEKKWVNSVNCLSCAAEQFPHSAHIVLTKSRQHEWGYIQRIIASAKSHFHPLKKY